MDEVPEVKADKEKGINDQEYFVAKCPYCGRTITVHQAGQTFCLCSHQPFNVVAK